MIDMKIVRENPELVKISCRKRAASIGDSDIDALVMTDKKWRELKKKNDDLRAQRNKISMQINQAKKEGRDIKRLVAEAKKIPEKIKKNEEKLSRLKKEMERILFLIPNFSEKSVPVGGEEKNKVLKTWGAKPKIKNPKPHWQLGEELEILDLERSAKISGSGFYILKGDGARIQRALVQFMLDYHNKNKFTEINPPNIVNRKTLFGTGQLPRFEEDLYKTKEQYLIPTAEVPVTNMYANEILREKELPKKFCAFTQCYRTEAGKHGTETRGIFRLHQFEKVEMVYFCKQEDSWKFLEEMTRYAEQILEKLKIPYRRVLLSTQDSGFSSAKTYDLEAWSPYLKKWLEVSSCSNCTDFQARRMNTRYQSGKELKFVHTLNGSGLALPRVMISLLECYQQKDGSIKIPAVLQKYMNGQRLIEARGRKD